jgi:hypothetical protein
MFDKVLGYLDDIGSSYLRNGEETSVTFLVRMSNASFHCILELREAFSVIIFYSVLNIFVPEHKRKTVSELITRINNELIIGNFELDFSDGEIRYKTSIDFEGIEFTTNLLRNIIDPNLALSDDYFYPIVNAIMTDVSPEEIMRKKTEFDEIAANSRGVRNTEIEKLLDE